MKSASTFSLIAAVIAALGSFTLKASQDLILSDIELVKSLVRTDSLWQYKLHGRVADLNRDGAIDSIAFWTQGSLRVPYIGVYVMDSLAGEWSEDTVYAAQLHADDLQPLRFNARYYLLESTSRPILVEVVHDFDLKEDTEVWACGFSSEFMLDTLFSFAISRIPTDYTQVKQYLSPEQLWQSMNGIVSVIETDEPTRRRFEESFPEDAYLTSVGYMGSHSRRLIATSPDTIWTDSYTSEVVRYIDGELVGVFSAFDRDDFGHRFFSSQVFSLTKRSLVVSSRTRFFNAIINEKHWYLDLPEYSD